MKPPTIECFACDAELEAEEFGSEEDCYYPVYCYPEACPYCKTSLEHPHVDYREDWCRGT